MSAHFNEEWGGRGESERDFSRNHCQEERPTQAPEAFMIKKLGDEGEGGRREKERLYLECGQC